MYEAFQRQEVFINRNMDPGYPMMAYCIYNGNQMDMMIQLWSIPFERMTIGESNRLIVLSKLIQKSVKRSADYLDLLRNERYHKDSPALRAEAFEELMSTYREAGEKNLTQYMLLKVVSAEMNLERAGYLIGQLLRSTDYIGYQSDGKLYIMLTACDNKGCDFVRENLQKKGINTAVSEVYGL